MRGDLYCSGTRSEPIPVPFCSRAWPVYALGCSYRSGAGGRHAGDSGWSCDWPATLSTGYLLKIPGQLGKNPGPR